MRSSCYRLKVVLLLFNYRYSIIIVGYLTICMSFIYCDCFVCWSSGLSGPFRATHLWQNIIRALRAQVEVRSRRKHLRVHADCFTGSDAVDAVLSYLMQNVVFCASEVSRLKAARLCQALMEAKVFEPVGTKLFRRDKEMTFEDSSCSLYHFLECKSRSSSVSKDCDSENVTPGELASKKKASRWVIYLNLT